MINIWPGKFGKKKLQNTRSSWKKPANRLGSEKRAIFADFQYYIC